MKPMPYIHIFAGISITALCLQIFSDFWLPLAIGAGVMLTISVLLRR
jgi:hypothetical protein